MTFRFGLLAAASLLGLGDPALPGLLGRYERRVRPFVELDQAPAAESPGRGECPESVEWTKNAISRDATLCLPRMLSVQVRRRGGTR
ncbi:hypothetical protein [Saccharothrix variisporea]|uniref:hypothetical protein n=1 Tax=Saccharothrix variisporea TaxID=543527 RepID=UPI0011C36598|nr:hypothetical protein [Saccharothrix variisporea]